MLKERPDWLTQRWAIFNSLRAVASYGTNRPDLGEIYLQYFIDEANNPAQTYLAVARRFSNIDRAPQARKILKTAMQGTPANQKILSELIRVELDSDEFRQDFLIRWRPLHGCFQDFSCLRGPIYV